MNVRTERLVARTFVLLSFLGSLLYAGPYDFAGGTGTSNDPYQIATAEQLASIGSDPNLLDKHFVLLNDIDLDPNLPGGRVFTQAVIAPSAHREGEYFPFEGVPFTGGFDGRSHRVRNMIIRSDTSNNLALFGGIGKEGVVTDLGIDGAQVAGQQSGPCGGFVGWNMGRLVRCSAEACVSGSQMVGGLVGVNEGEIIECWSAGEAVGDQGVGGLAGANEPGVILRSHADSRVVSGAKGIQWFGGLVGENTQGLIVDCYATGAVSAPKGKGSSFGGLVGNAGSGVVANSYATGDVSGGSFVGGLVGNTEGGVICDCYATGEVHGILRLGGLVGSMEWGGHIASSYSTGWVASSANGTDVGGLVGYRVVGTNSGCFWDTETSGLSKSAGGVGLTTAEMQNGSTFTRANWDWAGEQANGTADPWFIPEGGGYPQLTVHSTSFQPHKLEGSGTPDNPYRIATAEDWGAVNHYDLGACYKLETDISFAGIAWRKAPIPYFEGRLEGAGKIVTDLKIEGAEHLGLFGGLGRQASVESFGIRNADLDGTGWLGVLAGENRGHITACCARGSVAGGSRSGALVGWNGGSITDSYASGKVTGKYYGAGGLTGWNVGAVRRSYAAAQVACLSPIPSLGKPAGGLVGSDGWPVGDIDGSYFLIGADGGPNNGLGVALTGIQMKQPASFAGWDFDATWTICEGKDYPRLRWENIQCEE